MGTTGRPEGTARGISGRSESSLNVFKKADEIRGISAVEFGMLHVHVPVDLNIHARGDGVSPRGVVEVDDLFQRGELSGLKVGCRARRCAASAL